MRPAGVSLAHLPSLSPCSWAGSGLPRGWRKGSEDSGAGQAGAEPRRSGSRQARGAEGRRSQELRLHVNVTQGQTAQPHAPFKAGLVLSAFVQAWLVSPGELSFFWVCSGVFPSGDPRTALAKQHGRGCLENSSWFLRALEVRRQGRPLLRLFSGPSHGRHSVLSGS